MSGELPRPFRLETTREGLRVEVDQVRAATLALRNCDDCDSVGSVIDEIQDRIEEDSRRAIAALDLTERLLGEALREEKDVTLHVEVHGVARETIATLLFFQRELLEIISSVRCPLPGGVCPSRVPGASGSSGEKSTPQG